MTMGGISENTAFGGKDYKEETYDFGGSGRKTFTAAFDGFSTNRKNGRLTVKEKNCAIGKNGGASPAFALKTAKVGGFIGAFPTADGVTFARIATPSEYGGGVIYKDAVAVGTDKALYRYDENAGAWEATGITFTALPKIQSYFDRDGRESAIFFGGKVAYYTVGGATAVTANHCYKNLGCVTCDRIFFADDDKTVRFSGVISKDSFTDSADEGGKIAFPVSSGLRGICALGKYVYAFFAKQVYRLDARGAARDFSAEEVPYAGGEIKADSPVCCGDKICFIADDGAYVFDGTRFTNFTAESETIDFSAAKSCRSIGVPGKFLYEIVPAESGAGQTAAAARRIYDTEAGTSAEIDLSLENACSYGDFAYVFSDGEEKQIVFDGSADENREYSLERENEDFGKAGRKTLRKIVLRGKGAVRLAVTGGSNSAVYTMELDEAGKSVATRLSAERFSFVLYLQSGTRVSGVKAEYSAFGGEI